MRADVTRRTAPCLVQCDACNDGDAVVYTEGVQLDALRREALKPRTSLRDATDRWEVKQALPCGFDTPTEPALYKVAVRYRYPLGSASRARHKLEESDTKRKERLRRRASCRLISSCDLFWGWTHYAVELPISGQSVHSELKYIKIDFAYSISLRNERLRRAF